MAEKLVSQLIVGFEHFEQSFTFLARAFFFVQHDVNQEFQEAFDRLWFEVFGSFGFFTHDLFDKLLYFDIFLNVKIFGAF